MCGWIWFGRRPKCLADKILVKKHATDLLEGKIKNFSAFAEFTTEWVSNDPDRRKIPAIRTNRAYPVG